jgi:hypothetical protein
MELSISDSFRRKEFISSQSISLPWNLDPPRDDIYLSYTIFFLLRGYQQTDFYTKNIDCPLSKKCLLAVATAYFGTKNHQRDITVQGLSRYGKALRELNEALSDESRLVSFDVMVSISFMSLFEVCSRFYLTRTFGSISVR